MNQPFFLGVNYPWANYAEDFGATTSGYRGLSLPENLSKVKEEFACIRDCGVNVVRWFLFADGRGGFLSQKGIPFLPGEFLFAEFLAWLEFADPCGLNLFFSLIFFFDVQYRTVKPP